MLKETPDMFPVALAKAVSTACSCSEVSGALRLAPTRLSVAMLCETGAGAGAGATYQKASAHSAHVRDKQVMTDISNNDIHSNFDSCLYSQCPWIQYGSVQALPMLECWVARARELLGCMMAA